MQNSSTKQETRMWTAVLPLYKYQHVTTISAVASVALLRTHGGINSRNKQFAVKRAQVDLL